MADDPSSGDCTCGGKIAKGRRDGFCSSWCAGRDAQGLPAQSPPPRFSTSSPAAVVEDAAPAVAPAVATATSSSEDEPSRPKYRQRRRPIADEIEDRLREADLLSHWQAAAVLDLADALDWNRGSLSARATAHRELERQMSELLRGQDEPGSKIGAMRDEVAERRARRQQARAGGA
jgi:hypothetical protein